MPLLAVLVIAFFVNVPVVHEGPATLWREAPALVVLAGMVDLFLVAMIGVSIRRRWRDSVQD